MEPLTKARRLLVLGSSSATFAEDGEADSLPYLLQTSLSDLDASTWRVVAQAVYQMPNMRVRALQAIEHYEPTAVLLLLAGNVYAEDSVMYSLYHRQRRLYRLASRAIPAVKAQAGGGSEGAPSARGLLFRLPRLAARRLFGMAPLIPIEDAISATIETLEALAAGETPVLCRISIPSVQQADQAEIVHARIRLYNERIMKECERLGIPWFDAIEALKDEGLSYRMVSDGLHMDFDTRRAVATTTARRLLAIMNPLPKSIPGAAAHATSSTHPLPRTESSERE